MRVLLDTHAVIWALTNDGHLSARAREVISSRDNIVLLSTASLWEIAIKNQKAPKACPYHEQEILEYCQMAGYELLDVKPKHVLALRDLRVRQGRALDNHDPFDRILIAQAKSEGAVILSHDGNFENYDEPCIVAI